MSFIVDCINCGFWDYNRDDIGEGGICRFRAPSVIALSVGTISRNATAWPLTNPFDGCGNGVEETVTIRGERAELWRRQEAAKAKESTE